MSENQLNLTMQDVLQSLEELEKNVPTAVVQQRAHARLDLKVRLTIRPGNSSRRRSEEIDGVTADVSAGGCLAVFPDPVLVGDVYWLGFDQEQARIPSLLARCLRCRLVNETAFEAGFSFFQPIDLKHVTEIAN